MSEIKVNKISPRAACGTVQLGDSGDTFTIPAGASITNSGTASGFGATGSASWNTTVKTSGFTAVTGEGYFVNTTGGAVSVNLPAGTAGAVVAFKDYANTFDTNALTLVQNGSDKIGGLTANVVISTEGIAITLVFIDSTQGWLVTDSGLQSEAPGPQFIAATGGTITTVCTNFKVHTFTGPGTFQVTNAGNSAGSNKVSYLVVAGGGGSGQYYGGAGGGGGFRESKSPDTPYTASPLDETNGLSVCATSYSISVGGGGAKGGPSYVPGAKGTNSVFSTITSTGGGFGGGSQPSGAAGGPGGSGGGGGGTSGGAGGSGNTPPTNPPQGKDGYTASGSLAGAGGGATVAGGTNPDGRQGGTGATTSITNSPVAYAGGGGGGPESPTSISPCGSGGVNTPSPWPDPAVRDGGTNKGGGGGADGGAGGSGIVVIRYKFQ
jgi:hypothetical protein